MKGVPEGALQLAWRENKSAYMVSFAERLSLVLAASLAREHDVRERRQAQREDFLQAWSGAHAFMHKPFDLEGLVDRVKEMLGEN